MKAIFGIAAIILTLGCAGSKPPPDSPANTMPSDTAPKTSVEAKEIAAEQNAAAVVEITFDKKSAKLNGDAKRNLDKFLNETKHATAIEEIKTIAWGDSEYPGSSIKKLSNQEIKLAEDRNGAVRDYLHSKNVKPKITPYNMTKRPGPFRDWWNTSDARIKKSLEAAGVPNTDTSVKVPSKAGKLMVLAIFSDKP